METAPSWYAAMCIFEHEDVPPLETLAATETATVYEERIVLLRANSFDAAIIAGEADAEDYAKQTGSRYVGYIMTYHLFNEVIGEGTEVYSLMRSSSLSVDEFLNHYYDDGTEHSQHWGHEGV